MKFKLLDKTENGYNYEATENGKVVKRGFVGITDKSEALSILENRTEPNEIDVLKSKLLSKVKSEVSKQLTATDYKVIRHRDEQELIKKGNMITSTLTATEYEELLKERKELRDWSNEKEAEINSKTKITELEKIEL